MNHSIDWIMPRLLKALIIFIPVVLFFYLLWIDINPSGRFEIHTTVGEDSPYVDRFLPDTRALGVRDSVDGVYQPVIDEPVYVSVHPPGDYKQLTVRLAFQNTAQPLVELGLVVNDDPLQYLLEPLQSLAIDNSDWFRLEEQGTVLLQRNAEYASIEAFETHPPKRSSIATFHHDLHVPYRDASYQPSGMLTTTSVSLRGYHEYLTYVKNEPLLLQVTLMDMNREYGADAVELLAVNEQGEMVGSASLEDDGVIEATQSGSTLRHVSLVVSDLPEGVYKVILKADRDIFFRTLATRQRLMTFVGPVFVGDEVGYREDPSAVRLWTDSKHLSFETYHADAAQRVMIGSSELLLPEAQVRYDTDVTEAGLIMVSAESGDFLMTADGKVAFSAGQFFNPDPVKLNGNTDLDDLGINFIIADYKAPEMDGVWLRTSVTFNLASPVREGLGEGLKLVLAAPGIASLQQELRVHDLTLTFERPTMSGTEFWDKIKSWFVSL